MRTELYSVRSSAQEVSFLNKNLRTIVKALSDKASIRVLYKTEIDYNPKKIRADLVDSLSADNPPELYIYVNALESEDSSSFRYLFSPLIDRLEKELPQDEVAQDGKTPLYPHIKIYPLYSLPGNYPAYCFVYKNKKILALPRISLVGGDMISYLCDAVNCAKEIFERAFTECPEGFVLSTEKPAKKNLFATLFAKRQKYEPVETSVTPISIQTTETNELDNMTIPPAKDAEIAETAPHTPQDEAGTDLSSENEEKPNKSKAFIKSIIPMKGDSAKAVLSKIVVLVFAVVFLVGAYLLLDFYVFDPMKNQSDMTDIQNIFYEIPDATEDEQGNTYASSADEKPVKNWKGLSKINKEIVGWVKLDKTKIDYPVLYHKGDSAESQFYLYKNYKKEYSDFGSIFLDYRCAEGVNSKHVILHGHNMGSDDSMFGSLIQYARYKGWVQGNTKFYKSAPVVKFDTPELEAEWVVFAVMKIDVSNENKAIFNYLLGDFSSDAQYMNFIYNIKERSYLNVPVPINENDRILTLSTCSYETDNMRTVVVARMVREGEDVSKYVSKVKQQTPLKDVNSTFSAEYKAGNAKWYDGKGKLKGDESLDYMEQAEMYTVKFVDAKGKTIASQQVLKGDDATAPTGPEPRKAADKNYYYTFKGWSPSFKNVTKDLTVKPVFNKHARPVEETVARATDPVEPNPQQPPVATQAPARPSTQAPAQPTTKAPTQPPATTTQPVPVTTLAPDPVENTTTP